MLKLNFHPNQGFTLIEVMVVTGISAFLILTTTSIFATFMSGNSRTQLQQQLKKEGNSALSQMEYLLRNARKLEDCQQNMTNFGFESFADGEGELYLNGDQIASASGIKGQSSTTKVYHLTSKQVIAQNLEFDCYSSALAENKAYFVQINFTLSTGRDQNISSQSLSQDFSRGIQIRNLSEL